ncbi:MAG: aromatic ring-hydroxylating dioxygenase subunit alpha [Gammaproteobacteria bacterium]|nr:aromatic ring-hydroxylating dioxygenase subunit alpha [Gammaproteobacteria bacterium]
MKTSPETDSDLVIGLEAKYFNDETIYQRVEQNIFYKTWQFACHASQLRNPGDYFTLTLFDQEIVVLRDKEISLRAFYNVCQHRGHKLVEGSGNKKLLVCPYHRWCYDLDGQLRAAPNSTSVAGFDSSSICLTGLRIEEFLGFVFINLDKDCNSMDASYPGVKTAILELCADIEQRAFAYEHTADEGCNWLTAVENYNECYHCKACHAEFARGIIDPGSYNIKPFGEGKVLRHSSKATQSDSAWYDVSGSDYGSFFLWPSSAIQIYPGGVVNSYYWRPLAVDDVRVHRGWYSNDGSVDEALQKVIDFDRDTTFSEDLKLVKNVQRGLQSRGYRPGPLIVDPRGGIDNENSIRTLHHWLREAVDQ